MTTIESRRPQMFPALTAAQIASARRFASGPAKDFEPGKTIFEVGESEAPAWLILKGTIDVFRRDGLGTDEDVVTESVGQFSGEISQLSGRPSIAGGRAGREGCTALPFDAPHLRALVVGSAEIGEIVMRAFILRRVAHIEDGGAGLVLVGRPDTADLVRLQGFLDRNGYPHVVLDASADAQGRELVGRLGVSDDDLPLMISTDGTVMKRPTNAEVGARLGITPSLDPKKVYDVAIVGAGPAGLATAVYATSEGLSVLVLDEHSVGGQAGASMRIENYLGFPTGITGQALAGRAFTQALKFGAEIAVPIGVSRLVCGAANAPISLETNAGPSVLARTVVIASGARYRRPKISNLDMFEGAGVSFWASPVEARLCAGEEVALVGGGNSAGQAVVFLAAKVHRLHLIIRAKSLDGSMSRYLIERIAALPNVEIHAGTEVVKLEGVEATGLKGAVFRERESGAEKHCELRHLFLFIGADPNSDWVDGCVDRDEKGFVVTGVPAATSDSGADRAVLPLETSQPGVFAIGDVRAGSAKRVAAAVGEGAAVVAQIHSLLAPPAGPRQSDPRPE